MTNTAHPLAEELHKLSTISKHAVVEGTAATLDSFKKHLHIEREVEGKLKKTIKKYSSSDSPTLIMICGNVGDGKSHILAKLYSDMESEMSCFKIHNDATEAHNPNERSNETLNKVLNAFKDENLGSFNDKVVLAINLGTLSKFLEEFGDAYSKLKEYVSEKKILDTDVIQTDHEESPGIFQHVNFTDYHMYSLTESGPKSKIISTLFQKITKDLDNNPIYKAYQALDKKEFCPIRYNFEFLANPNYCEALENLVIQAIVKKKEIISVRSLLNFIYDLMVPIGLKWEHFTSYKSQISKLSSAEKLSLLLPNYLFEHPELSSLFKSISALDPCQLRYPELDSYLIELNNSENPSQIFGDRIKKGITSNIETIINHTGNSKADLTKLFIRLNFFGKRKEISKLSDPYFDEYMLMLFQFNNGSRSAYRKIYELTQEAARKWYGDPKKSKKVVLNIGRKQSAYRVFKDFKAEPNVIFVKEHKNEILTKFTQEFALEFKYNGEGEIIKFHIDFGLFNILNRIQKGYRPNKRDNNNYVSFVNQIEKLINQENAKMELEVDEINVGKHSDYELSKGSFGEYKFRAL